MGNRIDVLAFLAQVLERNTTGYRSDFQYDVRMLTQAAQEKDMRGSGVLLDEPPQWNMVCQGTGSLSARQRRSLHLDILR